MMVLVEMFNADSGCSSYLNLPKDPWKTPSIRTLTQLVVRCPDY